MHYIHGAMYKQKSIHKKSIRIQTIFTYLRLFSIFSAEIFTKHLFSCKIKNLFKFQQRMKDESNM